MFLKELFLQKKTTKLSLHNITNSGSSRVANILCCNGTSHRNICHLHRRWKQKTQTHFPSVIWSTPHLNWKQLDYWARGDPWVQWNHLHVSNMKHLIDLNPYVAVRVHEQPYAIHTVNVCVCVWAYLSVSHVSKKKSMSGDTVSECRQTFQKKINKGKKRRKGNKGKSKEAVGKL